MQTALLAEASAKLCHPQDPGDKGGCVESAGGRALLDCALRRRGLHRTLFLLKTSYRIPRARPEANIRAKRVLSLLVKVRCDPTRASSGSK